MIDVILEANGLYREKMEGTDIYFVKKASVLPPLPPAPLSSKTFFLQYSKAENLGEILVPLLSKDGGTIITDTRTNSVTIRDTNENLKQLSEIIASR